MKRTLLLMVSVFILSACNSPELQPIEETQTTVAIQQQQFQLTQSAMSLVVTQTALAGLQATQNAQIFAKQTKEALMISVTNNANWVPVEREFDGVAMVLVPAGCFEMGSKDGDSVEKPMHEQCFDAPFWMDKYEVTQADFDRLGGVQGAAPRFSGDQRPVENITWFEARDFCELRMSRLPTEAEWEYAARSSDSLVYPWGNRWNVNKAVWNRNDSQGTANVGSIPAGKSWVGALDLSGNVWEWTSSLNESYPYDARDGREADTGIETGIKRVLRGGSWLNDSTDLLRSAYRYWNNPNFSFNRGGFRCARSYD